MIVRVTCNNDDKGWGCCYRSGQMLVANSIGAILNIIPTPKNTQAFGRHTGPNSIAHLLSDQSKDIAVVRSGSVIPPSRLLLVPMRLGMNCIEARYIDIMEKMITKPSFSGAIIGEGNSSYYAHAWNKQTREFICVDPHCIKDDNIDKIEIAQCIRICMFSMAPSMCLAFLDSNNSCRKSLQKYFDILPLAN